MESIDSLRGFEAYGLQLDVPGSLRRLADQIEAEEIKDFVITVIDGDEGDGMILCRDEMLDALMRAVVEHVNDYLESKRTTTH